MRFLAAAFDIKPGEHFRVLLLLSHCFFVTALIIAGKTTRDAFFLSRYDRSLLPLMFVAVAICVSGLVTVDTYIARRFGARTRLLLLHGMFGVSLVALYGNISGWLVAFFYVWMEVINAWMILQFWDLAAQVLDSRQAKRLFGLIGGGGSIAGVIVGFSVKPFVDAFGAEEMVALIAGLVFLSGGLALAASRQIGAHARQGTRPQQRRARPKLNPYFTGIALVVVLSALVTTVIDYQFKIVASDIYPDEGSLLGFLGLFHAVSNVLTLFIQVFGHGFVMSRFGVAGALLIIPILLSTGSFALLFLPGLWSVVFIKGSDQIGKFAINNSALEMLWIPVPASARNVVKPFVKGTVKLVAEGTAGLAVFVLAKIMAVHYLSVVTIAALAWWIARVAGLRSQYREALVNAIEKRQVDSDTLSAALRDPGMSQVINGALEGDETQQLFALEMIEGLPLSPWRANLQSLLRSGSEQVRKRILEVAGHDPSVIPDQLLRDLISGSDAVAADALIAAGHRRLEDAQEVFLQRIEDRDPEFKAAAAVGLLELGAGHADEARSVLRLLLESDSDSDVAAALSKLDRDYGLIDRGRFEKLASSTTPSVREAALSYANRYPLDEFLPAVVLATTNPQCATHARLVLNRYASAQVVRECRRVLSQHRGSREVCLGLIRTLRYYPGESSAQAIVDCIDGADTHLLQEIAGSLRTMSKGQPLSSNVASRLQKEWSPLIREAYRSNRLLCLTLQDESNDLLEDYYRRRFENAVVAFLKLRTLDQQSFPIEASIEAIRRRDAGRLSFALDLIDEVLTVDERPQILPLADSASPKERDSHGAKFYSDLPVSLDSELERSAYSENKWCSVISLGYLLRADPTRVVRSFDWDRVPVSYAHRELVTGASRDGLVSLPKPSAARFLLEGASLPMYSILEKTLILRSVNLFEEIPAEAVSRIAQIAEEITAEAGTRLFSSGDFGDSLYIIVNGKVRIHKGSLEFNVLAKGDCFGEMALLDQAPRSADATILEDSVLFRIHHEDFFELMSAHVEIMRNIIRLLIARIRAADERLSGSRD